MEHSLILWVPDVYNNDIIMYMVYLVHVHYMYQIMFACHSSTVHVHVYDLLHKLSIADNYVHVLVLVSPTSKICTSSI